MQQTTNNQDKLQDLKPEALDPQVSEAGREEVLRIKDMNVTYVNRNKKVKAVRHASLTIYKGDSMGLIGESGSGKSTLAMALLGLLPKKSTLIDGEAIFMGDKNLLTLSNKELNQLRWTEIAVVFQKAMNSLSPVHRISTVFEDIYLAHKPGTSKQDIRKISLALLDLVNLPERVYTLYPHELSGGMLQRVAIAMSLLFSPQLLIFDEATTALDVVTQGQILKEIQNMEEKLSTTRIMITHDMSVVAASCNKMAVLYAGEILEFGYVSQLMKTPYHPYTQALLASFPALHGEKKQLESIPGFLPDLSSDLSARCVFAPRCKNAGPRCHKEKPYLKPSPCGCGEVACFMYDGGVE